MEITVVLHEKAFVITLAADNLLEADIITRLRTETTNKDSSNWKKQSTSFDKVVFIVGKEKVEKEQTHNLSKMWE